MSTTAPIEIKVIYSASSRDRRRRGKVVSFKKRSRAAPWLVLGVLNLVAAGGLSYATWWRVDSFIYDVFIWKTPLPGVDADEFTAQMFPGFAARPRTVLADPVKEELTKTPKYVGKTATMIIGTTAYSWLALATMASCALALSAGAALSRAGGSPLRRIGVILTIGGLLGLGWATYRVLIEYGLQYAPRDLRLGMTALVLLAAAIGLAFGRGGRGLARLAAITLILSAVGTTVALRLGGHCDVVSAGRSAPLFVILAFAVHSIYGWLLLAFTFRKRW